jgi:tetratricopeptide (TPR) repeat protein
MPTTYNGIGTHYYGKRNVHKRRDSCPHCGRSVELISYDTRLWFVVLLIPVIPLGRKRIIDYCPACSRHYAADADKWETAKQLEISGALEKYRTQPTPENAIAAHQQLLGFHQREQAADFRKAMIEKFDGNAKVHAYLGAALEHLGQFDESHKYFARALALRPDLPEARIGVAMANIRAGRPDDARKLLDFMEKAGSSQLYSLAPLDMLARAYQTANRHDDALAVFAILQEELPKLAEEKWFRQLVSNSEKESDTKESQLPKLPFSWKHFFTPSPAAAGPGAKWRGVLILAAILGLGMLALILSNEYIRRNRTLHIVNAFPQVLDVRIPGVPDLKGIGGLAQVVLPEGRYRATISGPLQQDVEFEIRSSYFGRWFDDPVWVLNPGGAAVLVRQQVVYSRDPPPASVSFHFGKAFESFLNVTHPFEPLPESLQMKESEQRTLVSLAVHHGDGWQVFNYISQRRSQTAALDFCETWLRTRSTDTEIGQLYLATAQALKKPERADAYLRAGLTNRPVAIGWHRSYQSLHENPRDYPALVGQYEAMLSADSTNSALLYLLGRITASPDDRRSLFKRAALMDPRNAYAHFALGYERMLSGDWDGAVTNLDRAVQLDPKDQGFTYWLFLSRRAAGQDVGLEQELRKVLEREPLNSTAVVFLIDTLAAQRRTADVAVAVAEFDRACRALHVPGAAAAIAVMRRHGLYAVGDFVELEKDASGDTSPAGRKALIEALLEQGRLDEALKLRGLPEKDDLTHALAFAVAFNHAGDQKNAAVRLNEAVQMMERADADTFRALSIFNKPTVPTTAELEDVELPPQIKAIFLTALFQKHKETHKELASFARRLNVQRVFPYHLVQRVTEESR